VREKVLDRINVVMMEVRWCIGHLHLYL